ncbi:uracil-DNA glycosylase family protein [Flavobacterium macacae]|uniref:Uracil-DNA glycosylase family protein n=1 Tax=Flavobacterium macacae TaxID=2488993 RepID=A0A3P3W707_9FLAO|nr:hypothetical protein [Flavobacterium macacae]RRJ90740.1 hypothetical protein EG849_09695 [Flavobacterium macacae]
MERRKQTPPPKLHIERHPFNSNVGALSIGHNTSRIIVGTFPAYEVVNSKSVQMNFYYGSRDNSFWDLLQEAMGKSFEIDEEVVQDFLMENKIGIIDMIEKCYRKVNRSSKDKDLAIVEQLDFIHLIQNCPCRSFYTTSKMVTSLILKQLRPVVRDLHSKTTEHNGFPCLEVSFCFLLDGNQYKIYIFNLYSPGPNGLRGMQKGLNGDGRTDLSAVDIRKMQYSKLMSNH